MADTDNDNIDVDLGKLADKTFDFFSKKDDNDTKVQIAKAQAPVNEVVDYNDTEESQLIRYGLLGFGGLVVLAIVFRIMR